MSNLQEITFQGGKIVIVCFMEFYYSMGPIFDIFKIEGPVISIFGPMAKNNNIYIVKIWKQNFINFFLFIFTYIYFFWIYINTF